jgi:hypothetical protein
MLAAASLWAASELPAKLALNASGSGSARRRWAGFSASAASNAFMQVFCTKAGRTGQGWAERGTHPTAACRGRTRKQQLRETARLRSRAVASQLSCDAVCRALRAHRQFPRRGGKGGWGGAHPMPPSQRRWSRKGGWGGGPRNRVSPSAQASTVGTLQMRCRQRGSPALAAPHNANPNAHPGNGSGTEQAHPRRVAAWRGGGITHLVNGQRRRKKLFAADVAHNCLGSAAHDCGRDGLGGEGGGAGAWIARTQGGLCFRGTRPDMPHAARMRQRCNTIEDTSIIPGGSEREVARAHVRACLAPKTHKS